ncbi:MAG: hypothetical protein JW866_02800 [Ignavibacteriales bacterium]|nr:hypothetical protein [Ignavibacteriales bacterium]
MALQNLFQTADWKAEKHSPVIEIIEAGNTVTANISIGKEIPHPNTTEHYIAWVDVYFHPNGEKFPYHLGKYEFATHGASTSGPNTSTIFSEPFVSIKFKTEKSGTIIASSYCNIHGLWASEAKLEV